MQLLHTIKQHWATLQMGVKKNPKLAIALVPLTLLIILLQVGIDPLRRQKAIEPANIVDASKGMNIGGNTAALPFEYMLGAVSGFRQVIAGLLWVRTDSFFHSGNYDAVLPMLRMITWLDPNWTDVYATGGWHITYNFTDTDQRSDRRYLPPGLAFLSEGIANNPRIFDLYKEKGWTNYDKTHDYEEAIIAYDAGWKADLKRDKEGNSILGADKKVIHTADINQVLHALGHSYERAGQVDEAIASWQLASEEHQRLLNAKDTPADDNYRHTSGLKTSNKNKALLQIRKQNRQKDTTVPVDPHFSFKVTRVRPRVLLVEGSWNCIGSRGYDAGDLDKDNNVTRIGRGIMMEGPVDGTRVEVRLQDKGYVIPRPESFSFEVDSKLTIMQDIISCRNGRSVEAGGVYIQLPPTQTSLSGDPAADVSAIYGFQNKESIETIKGVPLKEALAGAVPISALGKKQLVTYAYAKSYGSKNYTEPSEIEPLFAKLKSDTVKLDEMGKKNIYIARNPLSVFQSFKREIDMSKDPSMYSFDKEEYDLFLTLNPRVFPDNIQDRLGSNGEGLKADARFVENIESKTITVPAFTKEDKPISYQTAPLRWVRANLNLTKAQILGTGTEVLIDSTKL
jgi:tetratricopeptide (TPR) repeat protein